MSPDRLLRALGDLATHQARTARGSQARQAAVAYRLVTDLRRELAGDRSRASAVRQVLRAVAILVRPLAGYRRAHRRRGAGQARPAAYRVTDAQIRRALAAAPTVQAAAERLGISRRTVERRRAVWNAT